MQHDLQMRAAARAYYRDRHIWADQPSFEEAERRRTKAYLEAIAEAQADMASICEMDITRQQMVLI
jgi:hypothetical protein